MGIDTDRFVSTVPQGAYCITCGETLKDPVEIIDCGHLLCSECWENVICSTQPDDAVKRACPFCGTLVDPNNIRKSKLTWNLIQNMDVYCSNKDRGCECIYKYTYDTLHGQKCPFGENAETHVDVFDETEKCPTCGTPAYEGKHDCTAELLRKLRRQNIQITNLELENSKISFKLATRGKQPEEGNYLMELKYNKEIRDLRTRLAVIQGEIGRTKGDCKFATINLSLERINGTLGFNIIGGTSSKEESSTSSGGIYVSRIVEGGAADQPGKLQLHDHIIEVDSVDLRKATHAFAVETFRTSGDPVKMTIQRQLKTNTTCEASTQTYGVVFAVTGEEKSLEKELQNNIRNKSNWLTLHDFNENDSINNISCLDEPVELSKQLTGESKDGDKSELYDSAYDTLLTQKSTRSLRPSSSNESGLDNCASVVQRCNVNKVDNLEKRHSTFFVIPGGEEGSGDEVLTQPDVWGDCSAAEQENEYEYEYEEVVLQKEDGKYGLLLCYGGDATDVAVYVGDMEENSVADVTGKIMVGDQIVQINGCHVNNVDEAYQMLQDNDEIQVIVARAVYEVQSEFYDDAEETDLDMLDSIMEESEPNYVQTKALTCASSASTSTISSASAASSRKAPSNTSTQVQVISKLPDTDVANVSHNFSTITENTLVECENSENALNNDHVHKNEKDSVKNSIKNFVKNALAHSDKKDKRSNSNSDDSCELPKFQRSDSNSNSSTASTRKHSNGSSAKSQDSVELLKARLKEQKQMSKLKAYADSPSLNRNRPINSNNNNNNNNDTNDCTNNNNKIVPQTNSVCYPAAKIEYAPFNNDTPVHQLCNGVPSSNVCSTDINRTYRRTGVSSTPSLKSAMKNTFRERVDSAKSSKKHVQIDSHPDWNETERRVWEEFKIIQSMEAKENKGQEVDDMKIEAEWRVRRSKDGKHIYIKKTNSSRNKILKEREKQIDLQRCGITTDDDAFTVYQGQYWNKDQRKRQLSRHNDRRKRLVQKSADRALYENKTEKAMAEMVQRKMTLPGKVFDNFVTVEEILTQRNRAGTLQGPIHVTTI